MSFAVLAGEGPFTAALRETAGTLNKECLFLTEEEALFAYLTEEVPLAFFVDLGFGLDTCDLIQKLKRNSATRSIPLVAFGDSLRADLLQDAKEAGADLVLPKSAFRDQFPSLLKRFDKNGR